MRNNLERFTLTCLSKLSYKDEQQCLFLEQNNFRLQWNSEYHSGFSNAR
jgi:hypothetical protein